MKHTKLSSRLSALILALVMTLSLAACSAKESADEGLVDGAVTNKIEAPMPAAESSITADVSAAPDAEAHSYAASDDSAAVYGSSELAISTAPAPETPPTDPSEPAVIDPDEPAEPANPGSPFVLTAGEWNDLDNWPFFTNLVNAGHIEFPSFGLDPRHRIKVNVTDASGAPLKGEAVTLVDGRRGSVWEAVSGEDGAAYLFYPEGVTPTAVSINGEAYTLETSETPEGQQGSAVMRVSDELTVSVAARAESKTALQVMFILDTTGSMGDEIAYLQKDFSSIAEEVGGDGVSYSLCLYRDDGDAYVTKQNSFTSDVSAVQALINAEYADGGGDLPEAVAKALRDFILDNDEWREDCEKVAFLIFDAPPHDGYDEMILDSVRRAARDGIHMVPVVASNADRATELFGRALAICTNGTYVFLTDDSGVGESHLEPIVGDYEVELLHDIIVRVINGYKAA